MRAKIHAEETAAELRYVGRADLNLEPQPASATRATAGRDRKREGMHNGRYGERTTGTKK